MQLEEPSMYIRAVGLYFGTGKCAHHFEGQINSSALLESKNEKLSVAEIDAK